MTMTHVLLTGAAGRIGSNFYAAHAGDFRFTVADRHAGALQPRAEGDRVLQFDIGDLDACREACRGVDAVVHLAADPSPRADFYESLLHDNFIGTFNVFRAAADAGVRRFVFASSVQAVEGYPVDTQVHPAMPVNPPNLYAVSKCYGEALGAYFARQEGMSTIAVRIGAYGNWQPGDTHSARNMSAYVSVNDLNQLLRRCLEVENVAFAIVHGLSNNRFKRLDLSTTRDLLDYQPQDDAFALLGVELSDR